MGRATGFFFPTSTTVALDSLVAVWVVQQMSHGEEGVTEYAGGDGALLGGDLQHALQQRHKLPPVHLLRLHVAVVVTQDQVHLWGTARVNTHTHTHPEYDWGRGATL